MSARHWPWRRSADTSRRSVSRSCWSALMSVCMLMMSSMRASSASSSEIICLLLHYPHATGHAAVPFRDLFGLELHPKQRRVLGSHTRDIPSRSRSGRGPVAGDTYAAGAYELGSRLCTRHIQVPVQCQARSFHLACSPPLEGSLLLFGSFVSRRFGIGWYPIAARRTLPPPGNSSPRSTFVQAMPLWNRNALSLGTPGAQCDQGAAGPTRLVRHCRLPPMRRTAGGA